MSVFFAEDFEDGTSGLTQGGDTFEVNAAGARTGVYGYQRTNSASTWQSRWTPDSIGRGNTFEAWVRPDIGGTNICGVVFGYTGASQTAGYQVFVDTRNNASDNSSSASFQVRVDAGTSGVISKGALGITSGTWYRIRVQWRSDGLIIATLFNTAGAVMAQISRPDTTYTSGLAGVVAYNLASFDDITFAKVGGADYPSRIINDQPVGYWRFEEASGSAQDAVGSTAGSVAGAVTYQAGITGFKGNHFSWNGAAGSVNLGDNAITKQIGNQTIEYWCRQDDFSARRNPWNKSYGGEGTITHEMDGRANYFWGTAGANTTPYQSHTLPAANGVDAGQWIHLVHIRDLTNNELRWYKNGRLMSIITPSYSAAVASTLNQFIGDGYTNPFHGAIDEVALYGYALNDEQVAQHYAAGMLKFERFQDTMIPGLRIASNEVQRIYIGTKTVDRVYIGDSRAF